MPGPGFWTAAGLYGYGSKGQSAPAPKTTCGGLDKCVWKVIDDDKKGRFTMVCSKCGDKIGFRIVEHGGAEK